MWIIGYLDKLLKQTAFQIVTVSFKNDLGLNFIYNVKEQV